MTKLSIATWNVNSIKVRLPHVLQWLDENPVDVLALQETKSTDENFPKAEIEEAGFNLVYTGQKTYNGVATISRRPIEMLYGSIPNFNDDAKRVLGAKIEGVHVLNCYVPNGQSVGSDKYDYKLDWLAHLTAHVKTLTDANESLVILGDYNIAPEDRDVHDPIAWEGHVLVSPAEREAFQGLLSLGLRDCFRLFEQPEKSYSWWDYRQMAFRRNRGLRIDHILATDNLTCTACDIDKTPRKWERPSDHTPVIATFEL